VTRSHPAACDRPPAALAAARALALAAALAAPASAIAIVDEIQVYVDDINKPGEKGLELHVNTTPKGRSAPAYPGDMPPRHSLRFTPEFSFGLTREFDWGFYFPTVIGSDGNFYAGGGKLRFKWMPIQPDETKGGWYAGGNLELSRLTKKYSESPYSSEVRTIFGYRAPNWLIGVNPIFEWSLSPGFRNGGPDFTLAVKAMHDVQPGVAVGFEHYAGIGKLAHPFPRNEQEHTLYLTLDVDRKPWIFNVGIGRGLTPATDRWTLKAIFEVPLK
jgi:hypothetical protein